MIRKLLVANRGEIARRIFRTCREMGIATVAVYSAPDRDAPFVREAGEAFAIGGAAPGESYLVIPRIIDAAVRAGADAVHPGYGFLAENAAFAQAVIDAGLIWVGPPPPAIASMGSKLESKRLMAEAGVPTLGSIDLTGMDESSITSAAAELGFPLLVKASAGGGGKGMRIVDDAADLLAAHEGAKREAAAAFGDDTMFLEPYLEAPRHIEIQVFADTHGNTVSLFERECSIQRRHQKIVEESPSTALTPELRRRMGEAATAAARAVGYVGAGTVEFLFQGGDFRFLEMNTRLQVEHPVTEEITGLDLVRLQLLVAAGEPLPPEALEPVMVGHAIEARLYAEDPRKAFLPVTGTLHRFRFPESTGLRVDTGVEDGSEINVHYDPMLAKVIAWAETRDEAASLLAMSLRRAEIHGSITNRDLLVRILLHPEFAAGNTDTHFLDRHDPAELGSPLPAPPDTRYAALAAALAAQQDRRAEATHQASIPTGWRNSPSALHQVEFTGDGGETISVGYRFEPRHGWHAEIDGVALTSVDLVARDASQVGVEIDGHLIWHRIHRVGNIHHVDGPAGYTRLVETPRFPDAMLEEEPGSLHAPMPGKVLRVHVSVGDQVLEGAALVVMEAMKMEHTLRSPFDGVVRSVKATEGEQVSADKILVVVEAT